VAFVAQMAFETRPEKATVIEFFFVYKQIIVGWQNKWKPTICWVYNLLTSNHVNFVGFIAIWQEQKVAEPELMCSTSRYSSLTIKYIKDE